MRFLLKTKRTDCYKPEVLKIPVQIDVLLLRQPVFLTLKFKILTFWPISFLRLQSKRGMQSVKLIG